MLNFKNNQCIMSLLRCHFHIVAQEPSDRCQNIAPLEVSIDAQKAYLWEGYSKLKGIQLKHSILIRVWNTAEGKQDCACKTNEYGQTAKETFTWYSTVQR